MRRTHAGSRTGGLNGGVIEDIRFASWGAPFGSCSSFGVSEGSDSGPRVLEDEAVSSEFVDDVSALVLVGDVCGATDVCPFI